MPFLINDNPFCLAIANLETRIVTFINPLGNELFDAKKIFQTIFEIC